MRVLRPSAAGRGRSSGSGKHAFCRQENLLHHGRGPPLFPLAGGIRGRSRPDCGHSLQGGAVRERFKEERRSAVRHPAPGMKFHRSAGTLTEAGIPVLSPERTHGGTRNNRNIINADKIF